EISLQTGLKSEGSGKFTFLVINIGDTETTEKSQTFKVTYTVPENPSVRVAGRPFSTEFANAIVEIATKVKAATLKTDDAQLGFTSLSAGFKFVSQSKTDGSGGIVLLPITINFGASATTSNTHEVTITFKK